MEVVWAHGEVTVRDACTHLGALAYTTVMTTMNILESKGFLEKAREDRAFRYTPTRSRQQVVGAMVKDFVNRVFDGAAQPLLLHLATSEALTPKERTELRRLIEKTPAGKDE
jgi:predicted transcriptional regulator